MVSYFTEMIDFMNSTSKYMTKFFTFGAMFVFVTACNSEPADYVKMISPTELNTVMQGQDIFLVDVHAPEQQHIKGTDLFVPYNDIASAQSKLPQDKNTPIYLYCKGGPMGNAAAKTLHELGYRNLTNLDGGAMAWKNAGLPLE
jgi:rhodanese-related sulfurtransferase